MCIRRRRRCARSHRTYQPQFDDVLQRAMAKDPAERYASAGELGRAVIAAAREAEAPPRQDLAARCHSERSTGLQVPPEPAASVGPGRRVLARAWSGAAPVAAVVAIVALTGSDEPKTRPRHPGGARLPPARPLPRGAACHPCRLLARTWPAPCSTGRSGCSADSGPAPRARGGSRATTL